MVKTSFAIIEDELLTAHRALDEAVENNEISQYRAEMYLEKIDKTADTIRKIFQAFKVRQTQEDLSQEVSNEKEVR